MKRAAWLRMCAKLALVAVVMAIFGAIYSFASGSGGAGIFSIIVAIVGAKMIQDWREKADNYELNARHLQELRNSQR
jgi:uncharacterized membrane protein YfcA